VKIIWLTNARNDLKALRRYIACENPRIAAQIAKQVIDIVQHLADHPEMGHPGRIHNTRELIVSGTSYIIPYRVINNTVEVLRVLHAAMKWPIEYATEA
jgi:toxin ParE1/3/4